MSLASSVAPAPRVGVLSHPWVRFGIRRLGRLLVSLWVLITASFLMIHLIPGDAVRAALGPTAPADLVATTREGIVSRTLSSGGRWLCTDGNTPHRQEG